MLVCFMVFSIGVWYCLEKGVRGNWIFFLIKFICCNVYFIGIGFVFKNSVWCNFSNGWFMVFVLEWFLVIVVV